MASPRPSGEAVRRRVRWQCLFVSGGQARRRSALTLLVLWGLLGAAPALAQEPGGRVLSVQGPVEVVRGSQTLPATVQLAVQPGGNFFNPADWLNTTTSSFIFGP